MHHCAYVWESEHMIMHVQWCMCTHDWWLEKTPMQAAREELECDRINEHER